MLQLLCSVIVSFYDTNSNKTKGYSYHFVKSSNLLYIAHKYAYGRFSSITGGSLNRGLSNNIDTILELIEGDIDRNLIRPERIYLEIRLGFGINILEICVSDREDFHICYVNMTVPERRRSITTKSIDVVIHSIEEVLNHVTKTHIENYGTLSLSDRACVSD